MIQEISGDFLQWLRGFYYVAKVGSFSRAGLEMGRNQSAISHQIKCLEREFGLTLIDRSGSRADLTPEGRFLFQKTITIFEQVRDMREFAKRLLSEIEGQVSIASTHAVIRYFLPRHVAEFSKTYPKVSFDITGGGRDHILTKVESAEADFGITNKRSVPKDLVYFDLFETKPVLITPKSGCYNLLKVPTLNELAQMPFISFPKTSTLTPWIEKTFREHGLELNVVAILNNFDAVKTFSELGMGVAIIDDYALAPEDSKRLNILPLRKHFGIRRYGVILRKTKHLSLCAKAFLRKIKPDITLN
jgi:DNA-binding transcriptional LysR family regulator